MARVLSIVLLVAGLTPAFAGEPRSDFEPYKLLADDADSPSVAHALALTFIQPKELQAEVAKIRSRLEDAERDGGDGDPERYLNDRLLGHGMSALGGKEDRLKRAIVWVALYKEFDCTPPDYVANFIRANRDSLLNLLQDFSWPRASQYVRNREWRKTGKR